MAPGRQETAPQDRSGHNAQSTIHPPTFLREDVAALSVDAPAVLRRRAPELVAAYEMRGWALPATIDRVYAAERAMRELGWQPRYGFAEVLAMYDQEHAEVLPPLSVRNP